MVRPKVPNTFPPRPPSYVKGFRDYRDKDRGREHVYIERECTLPLRNLDSFRRRNVLFHEYM